MPRSSNQRPPGLEIASLQAIALVIAFEAVWGPRDDDDKISDYMKQQRRNLNRGLALALSSPGGDVSVIDETGQTHEIREGMEAVRLVGTSVDAGQLKSAGRPVAAMKNRLEELRIKLTDGFWTDRFSALPDVAHAETAFIWGSARILVGLLGCPVEQVAAQADLLLLFRWNSARWNPESVRKVRRFAGLLALLRHARSSAN